MAGLNLSDSYLVLGSRVVYGLLKRWTDIFFLPQPAWGEAFNPYNATQTHSKLEENTFFGMTKVRA